MPVRQLGDSVLKWPDAESVRSAAEEWAGRVAAHHDHVRAVGYFGSFARDDWGVGSDLDIVVVTVENDVPFEKRGLDFDVVDLPVPVDLLVYTEEEWVTLSRGRMAHADREMV
ncbi:MAG: nucleotidyltransferase domain-containing protein, partial [Rhodothermales bacterium]